MDPATMAVAAAALVAKKAAETIAGEAGESGWAGMKRLYDLIWNKLSGKPEAAAALDALEAAPDDEASRTAVAGAIEQAVRHDPGFAGELEQLVGDAQRNQAVGHIVNQIAGNVGKMVNVEGDVHGGMNF